jgi:bidirectional [NiFe] hydrogenase diaphorase subunit
VARSAPPAGGTEARGQPHPSGDERFTLLDTALRKARYQQDQLIEILHAAQEIFGYLADDVLLYVARGLRLPRARVYGVATFYHLFTREPMGEHMCSVCTGTACFVKGADAIIAALQREYGVFPGETTEDGRFTLTTTRCVGSCGLAPLTVVDGEVFGHLSIDEAVRLVRVSLEEVSPPIEQEDAVPAEVT